MATFIRTLFVRGPAGLVILLLLTGFTRAIAAENSACTIQGVTIYAQQPGDSVRACAAITKTLSFLQIAGLTKPVSIEIYIVATLPEHPYSGSCIGLYNATENRIDVLSFEACRYRAEGNRFWGLPYTRELHDSFIMHETAHAVAGAHFEEKPHGIAAQEYIAYTTQIALMSENVRSALLHTIPNTGFETAQEITSVFHDLAPSVFAVKAYRHFQRKENGPAFYQKLIQGNIRLNGD